MVESGGPENNKGGNKEVEAEEMLLLVLVLGNEGVVVGWVLR